MVGDSQLRADLDPDGDGVSWPEDCDDEEPAAWPGAEEICDEIDNDCDGVTDEAAALEGLYLDSDGDGYGDPNTPAGRCDAANAVQDASDCDDDNAALNPEASDFVGDETDQNCDGADGFDGDGDGAATLESGGVDCDDDDPNAYPGAAESCDGVDSDCDRVIELDEDGDGVYDCEDCDEANANVNPYADEICDGLDNDCDGYADDDDPEGTSYAPVWYRDRDGDGWGDIGDTEVGCAPPSGYVGDSTDCDDGNTNHHPAATERCDGDDDDCDKAVDEDGAADAFTWYADDDADGYGDAEDSDVECYQPTGYVLDDTDCDDGEATTNPGATEIWYDGTDADCAGDDDYDADADGYQSDTHDDGYGYGDDCDDARADVNIAADEHCDGSADEDCDGGVDEGDAVDAFTWYADTDADTHGDPSLSTVSCYQPTSYVLNDNDCDDDNAEVNPDAWESCDDGLDNDCSGAVDDCLIVSGGDLDGAWSAAWAESSSDNLGWSVSLADVNDDNIADVLIGAPHEDEGGASAGAVYAFYGPITGDMDTSAPDLKIEGESSSSYVGSSIVGDIDIDNDGYADLLIGAYGYSSSRGAIYLLHGPLTADLGAGDYDAQLLGENSSDYAGWMMSTAGDINDDDYADLLIGAYGSDDGGSGAGVAYIVHGPLSGAASLAGAHAVLIGEGAGDSAGRALFGGEDLNGDGTPDAMVGASGDDDGGSSAGAGYVIYGPVSGDVDLSDADVKVTGAFSSDYLGSAVSAGDIDGDGYADGLFGAPHVDDTVSDGGVVYVVLGPVTADISASSADFELYGEDDDTQAGDTIEVGDLNADGNADLILGVPEWDSINNCGGAYVFYGPLSASASLDEADALIYSSESNTEAGHALSADGDTNGDGFLDLLIGGPYDDTTSSNAGAAWLLRGGER